MARINIMIAGETLEAVDEAASEDKLSRSGWLQNAARQCLEARRKAREADEHKRRMENAAATMDRLADKFGKWDGAGTIRRLRDRRTGVKR